MGLFLLGLHQSSRWHVTHRRICGIWEILSTHSLSSINIISHNRRFFIVALCNYIRESRINHPYCLKIFFSSHPPRPLVWRQGRVSMLRLAIVNRDCGYGGDRFKLQLGCVPRVIHKLNCGHFLHSSSVALFPLKSLKKLFNLQGACVLSVKFCGEWWVIGSQELFKNSVDNSHMGYAWKPMIHRWRTLFSEGFVYKFSYTKNFPPKSR